MSYSALIGLSPTFIEQGRAAIERFVSGMDGDRARRTKWNGLAAELDAELKIVKVKSFRLTCGYSKLPNVRY